MNADGLSDRQLHEAERAIDNAVPEMGTWESEAVHMGRLLLAEVQRLRDEAAALRLYLDQVRHNDDGVAEIDPAVSAGLKPQHCWTVGELAAFELGWEQGRVELATAVLLGDQPVA